MDHASLVERDATDWRGLCGLCAARSGRHCDDDCAAESILQFCAEIYDAKAASWKKRWPELTILPATGIEQA
jgi:hypothetical protein